MRIRFALLSMSVLLGAGALTPGCRRRTEATAISGDQDASDTPGPDVVTLRKSVLFAKGRPPIAIGPTTVMFTDTVDQPTGRALLEIPKRGGPAVERTTVHFARGFAVDERGLFELDEAPYALYSVPQSGTAKTLLADDRYYQPYYKDHDFIAVYDGFVYWLSGRTPTHEPGILRVPESGGIPKLIAEDTGGQVGGLAVDAARVYVTSFAGVVSVPSNGGGKAIVLAPPDHGMGPIAVNSTHVYWLSFEWKDSNQVEVVWQLNRTFLTGGEREIILDHSHSPRLFALGAHAVYWVTEHELHRAELDGRNDALVESADGQALAVDDIDVYFTNGTEIRRLAQ